MRRRPGLLATLAIAGALVLAGSVVSLVLDPGYFAILTGSAALTVAIFAGLALLARER